MQQSKHDCQLLMTEGSVEDPNLLISDPDPTWQVITNPDLDPTWRVITDPDQDPTWRVISEPDQDPCCEIFVKFLHLKSE